jgi:type VI secretion system secreted protein Hcp
MAAEHYFTAAGLTGESQKNGATGWIEINSFSWGGSNPSGVSHGTGSGTGKWDAQSFTITKSVDLSTPVLFAMNASGKHMDKGTFISRLSTGGSTTNTFLQYDFEEVYVDSITHSGSDSESGKPLETVSFSYKTFNMTYTPQNADGSMGSPIVKGWDISKNQAK